MEPRQRFPCSAMSFESQVQTVPSSDRFAIPDDPWGLFDALFVDNSRVCSRCYLRVRTTLPVPWHIGDGYAGVAHWISVDRPAAPGSHPTLDNSYFETPTLPGRLPKDYPPPNGSIEVRGKRHCANCGEYEPDTNLRTRSLSEARDAAANLSMTLTEYDITHDWPLLLALVTKLKSSPVTHGDDHETFRRAIAKAVEASR